MYDAYFANLPPEQIGDVLTERTNTYYETLEKVGKIRLWRNCYNTFYGLAGKDGAHRSSEIGRGGEQGELYDLTANHYRNLLTHLHILVTQQKPSYDARSTNTDSNSQAQTILANAILEYYLRHMGLSEHFKRATEIMIALAGEAYVLTQWDESLGEDIAVDEMGQVVRSGDVDVRVYHPIDIIRSLRSKSNINQDWYIVRDFENRYDMAAIYPEALQEIMHADEELATSKLYNVFPDYHFTGDDSEEDIIPVYTFFHRPTPACREGRYVKFLSDGTVLKYEDMSDYPRMPLRRMAAYNQQGTSFGYTVGFDLLCVQEAIDILYSTVLTNQATFGVQNIWVKPGHNLNTTQFVGGLNVLESMEKPEPVNLTNTPAEIFNFLKGLEQLGEVLSGVNSVARGQPEASLKSGTALAMVASQAIQFSNGIQEAYVRVVEGVGQDLLDLLKMHVREERLIPIAGQGKRTHVKAFTGDSIKSVSQVMVDMGNPLTRNLSGQIQIADNLLSSGMIQRPEQYLTLISTGKLDHMIDDEMEENLQIDRENEALREGIPVQAIMVDQHVMHIKNHKSVLSGLEERSDPNVVKATMDHIQQHINHLATGNPYVLQMLGMNPITQQDPATAGQQAPQPNAAPPGPDGPPEEPPAEKMPAPSGTPPEVAANMPTLPKMPPQ